MERANQRIKEFLIIQGEVDICTLRVLEQVFHVCVFLAKFQKPIVRYVMLTRSTLSFSLPLLFVLSLSLSVSVCPLICLSVCHSRAHTEALLV